MTNSVVINLKVYKLFQKVELIDTRELTNTAKHRLTHDTQTT
jgi:hypothetical protein